jgi:2-dehydro-3-deoxyphosphogluconate aldolase/(4S)-4-hydroxy-2-oxoglutarate aldolase
MWQADPGPLLTTPVVPVLTIGRLEHAVPLARALAAGGLSVIEVTLRTDVALSALRAIIAEVPEVVAGIGTVLNSDDVHRACDAGAAFLVSPGTSSDLAEAFTDAPIPALPGCSTVSEAMMLMDFGFPVLKFFPAEPSGGVRW